MKENEFSTSSNPLADPQRSSALRQLAKDLIAASDSENFKTDVKQALSSFTEAYSTQPGSQFFNCSDSVSYSTSIQSFL